ncbi:MAG: glycosyltransferase family 9 protein [Chloroflexota bacterium]
MTLTDPSRVARWADARRILVVRLDGLGDVLMTTPAIRALAGAGRRTRREIRLLTSPAGAALAPLLPEVDGTIVAEPPWLKPGEGSPRPADEDAADIELLAERLREGRFDAAVIFTVQSQSALPSAMLCLMAGIPLRLAHARENPYRLLTDWVQDPEPLAPVRHEVRRQLDLVAAIGARVEDEHLSVRVPPAASRLIRELLRAMGIEPGDRWVVVHPGASASSRRYPIEAFARVVGALVQEHGVRVVLAGGPEEMEAVAELQAAGGPGCVPIAGVLDLAHLAALLAVAPVFIGNNSGPAHLAAAVGTPVVDLYALTNLQHAPWGVPSRVLAHDVPCKGCRKSICPVGHHACLRGVLPASVVAATLSLLEPAVSGTRVDVVRPPAGILSGLEVGHP